MDAVKQMTYDWSLGRHGELFSGTFYQPLDQTVPHQFFASSMLVTPLLRGVFGWDPDAPNRRARLAPQLPADWREAAVRGLRVGETTADVEIRGGPGPAGGERRILITSEGLPVDIEYVPDAPAGAGDLRVTMTGGRWVDGEATDPVRGTVRPARTIRMTGDRPAEITVTWKGGLSVAPPRIDLEPGQRSTGLRIIDLQADAAGWTLVTEGSAGRAYRVELFGVPVEAAMVDGSASVEAVPARTDAGGGRFRVRFAPGDGRRTATIRLTPIGR